ncbi:MAG: hypothetical protein A2V64_07230 [Bacteroidetes bacterium RBG_13_43_22]|nr:MAG: hypothetical protein A2V64_07230 [Bacteroidetes bacterium RBG_13_43_22]
MTGKIQYAGDVLAKIISVILHPLFIPVYGLLIIFSAPTLIGYLPYAVKRILLIIILINNVLLPFSFIPYFKFRNIISTWTIDSRRERIIPLITSSFFYSVTVFITFRYHIPAFIKSFILAAALVVIAVTIINFWWKISIHAAGAGVLVALVAVLSIKMNAGLPWFLIAVILSAGLALTSRLWLNSHSPKEVWSGLFLGFLCSGLLLLFY